ncbi:MAG: hypothetical protein JST79_16005 [Acidobacteria bacterium]|nr:hypothetical protein [Acidobacteriota bacterium]
MAGQTAHAQRISLDNAVVLVDASEPSYVQYGAKDLASYLGQITGKPVPVGASVAPFRKSQTVVALGEKMARAAGADLGAMDGLGEEGAVLRSAEKAGRTIIAVAGTNPHGTNAGIATLLQKIRADGKTPYLAAPLDLREKPDIAVRGLHLNGWPLKYPYAFRAWKEQDWKRFVDIAWAQRINLFYLWPFMEIIPLPLSAEDEAYLQEVQRVIEYAQKQRGMEVWIMQSANRIAVSDCKVKDPRYRTYWVPEECQQDMNPADPQQFANILTHFEALYKIVNNADGFCFIDSDPGGWPGSPLSDQTKIFNGARKLLNRHNIHGEKTKLIDWMWLGWGGHPTGEGSGKDAVAFMESTIRNFKENLAEPWELISGMAPYLQSAKNQNVLNKTIYLQYGAIENEPAFPATNLGMQPVREMFEKAAEYPALRGVMGNNELMSLQFPRTYYFFNTAWDYEYRKRSEPEVLDDLAGQLYPDHQALIGEAFGALRESDPKTIDSVLANLQKLIATGSAGRPGAIGRFLFPEPLAVAKNLELQLEIRASRQALIAGMQGQPDLRESSRLVEDYFDKLLAWNQETGWDKMIDITIWRSPIYEEGKDLTQAMSRLKKILAEGRPYTSYSQFEDFFMPIREKLLKKYGKDSVMIGCIDPFRLAVMQGW